MEPVPRERQQKPDAINIGQVQEQMGSDSRQRYQKGWGFTCNHLLDLLKNPPQVTSGAGDEVINEADVDDIGFGVGYTPLNTCKRGARDDFPEVENVQQWVSDFIKDADKRHNGAIAGFINNRLQDESKQALAPYLQ